MFLYKTLLLGTYLTYASASAVLPLRHTILHPRAAPINGSCISGPDTSCVSLVSLCVASIASGAIGSTAFWSSNVCAAAATCAGMGAVMNAACCAGTCHQPTDIESLDYDNVYATMVGDCAFQPGGCSLTWQPFVDWFYNTIQGTGTNNWPLTGDYVLGWWSEIATWTGFCAGDECVDGAIPYTNFNDWFHFSSAVVVTTPGTPEYAPPLSTNISDNQDMWTPNFYWPCPFDDLDECWWDYGPPTAATSITDANTPVLQVPDTESSQISPATSRHQLNLTTFSINISDWHTGGLFPFGRAPYQPPDVPPPVYVNKTLFPLHLMGTTVDWGLSASTIAGYKRDFKTGVRPTPTRNDPTPATSASGALIKRATITPAACNGGRSPIETPTVLPTLTYFCTYLPNICANIRSHGDWDHTTDSMQLTYDPFGDNSNRRDVCTTPVKDAFRLAGKCDPMDHNPVDWKISCDEFPFNTSLEGGEGNAIVQGVPSREQQYQGTLQSSITYLRRVQSSGATSWQGNSNKMCHQYLLKLVDTIPANAEPRSVGSLDPGSAFFAKTNSIKWIKDRRVINNRFPRSFTSTSWAYAATDTALVVPGWKAVTFNCAPSSTSGCTTTTNAPLAQATAPISVTRAIQQVSAVAIPSRKRDEPACTVSAAPPLPTTSEEASAIAAASADTAKAAAAAAAAALASASNPTADQAAVASVAVSAASALAPAAAALAAAASDDAVATALAASQSAYDDAQDSISSILSLGDDLLPDWLFHIHDSVSSSSSAVANAIASKQNVMNPQIRTPPDTAPPNDPVVNSGPPPNVPPAACFPAGSTGFVKIGDTYLVNQNGKAQATLVDVGSATYFGITIPTNVAVEPIDGCQSIYTWNFAAPALQPDFQVDCSTNELGGYWNGEKLTCYAYNLANSTFLVICGGNVANVYSCLQNSGLYGQATPAVFTWATS